MPIIDLQRRVREAGRIRMGKKVERGGKTYPEKLDKFRLTSSEEGTLQQAAAIYGGKVVPWKEKKGQFELFITAQELDVFVAPTEVSQWYEQWTKGGCSHRCDGQINNITDEGCSCDPENRACSMVTRIGFFLPLLQSLGIWRLETHGYYAATELPETVDMLKQFIGRGIYVPAMLAIEHRTVVRDGKTKQFIVPALRIKQSLGNVMALGSGDQPSLAANAITGEVLALPAGPVPGAREIYTAHGLDKEKDIEIKARLEAIEGAPTFSQFLSDLYARGKVGFAAILKELASMEGKTDDDQEAEEVEVEIVEDGKTKQDAGNVFDEPQEPLL